MALLGSFNTVAAMLSIMVKLSTALNFKHYSQCATNSEFFLLLQKKLKVTKILP